MMRAYLFLFLQTVLQSLLAFAIFKVYRTIRRRSSLLAGLFAAGLLLRAFAGLSLFTISYFNLPILSQFHTGDGFWNLAPDARAYYQMALAGPQGVPSGAPSALYLLILAAWLTMVGAGPLSPLLLNLLCYAAANILVVFAFSSAHQRNPVAAIFTSACLAFSPVLILVSTQSLKDSFFTTLQIALVGFVWHAIRRVRSGTKVTWTIAGVAAVIGAVAGIRTYFAFISWVGLVLTGVVLVAQGGRRRPAIAGVWLVLLVVAWLGSALGGGAAYREYSNIIGRVSGIRIPYVTSFEESRQVSVAPPEATAVLSGFRNAYIRSGGGTSLARGASAGSLAAMVTDSAWGLADMFVPMSALLAIGVVEFTGGRGILVITDVDTAFIDVTALLVLLLAWRRRRAIRDALPQFCFLLTLVLVTALLLAYVVTNYGTLFRLRLLPMVPFWMLPLALPANQAIRGRAEHAQVAAPTERPDALSQRAV
jgi:hypothetical protein